MATSYLQEQAEVINPRIPNWFNNLKGPLYTRAKRPAAQMMGERDFRAPYRQKTGGAFGTFNPDGGAVGIGTAAGYGVAIGTFFSLRFCMQLTQLAIRATQNKKIAQQNALKQAIKDGIPEFSAHIDQVYHNDGTAKIATAIAHSASSGVSVYTMDTVTGVKWLRRGQRVIVYQADASAARDSGASRTIMQVNWRTREVTLDAVVTSGAATDIFMFEGVSGASPTGPWGLQYINNTSTSGTTYGITRANELEIVPSYVSAGGAPTTMKMVQLLVQYYERWKEDPNWIGLMPPQQMANLYQENLDFSEGDIKTLKAGGDLIPEGLKKKRTFAGVPMEVDFHQMNDRFDFIDLEGLLRLQLPGGDIQFWENPATGQHFFQLVDTTTGAPKATTWFAWETHENIFHDRPGRNGVMTGLTAPTY